MDLSLNILFFSVSIIESVQCLNWNPFLLYDASERDAKQLNGALQINDVQHFTEILATRPSRHIRHIRRDFVKYFKHDILEEVQKSFDLPVYAFMKAVFEKERPIGGDQIKTNEDGQCYRKVHIFEIDKKIL